MLYREDETFWIYKNGYPYARKSTEQGAYDLVSREQLKFPTDKFSVTREHVVREELRSFAPIQRQDKYTEN